MTTRCSGVTSWPRAPTIALGVQEEHDLFAQALELAVVVDREKRAHAPWPRATAHRESRRGAGSAAAAICGWLRTWVDREPIRAAAIVSRGRPAEATAPRRRLRASAPKNSPSLGQQPVGLDFGQRLHAAQLALDRRASCTSASPSVLLTVIELLLRPRENVAELAELGLDGAQQPPHLASSAARWRACEIPSAGCSASPPESSVPRASPGIRVAACRRGPDATAPRA